ncbi:MAG: MarR family winged helix-turn-helix transcriptional regulator [Acidimicrobiales bacterium]|jgi:DNA-binding MarR family transcriptional regulator
MSAASTLGVRPSTRRRRAELTERIFELRPLMKRLFGAGIYRELREELQSVTIHQLTALGHLKGGSVTMRELAKDLDVSESSATAVTDRLVRQGLVERQSDPSDRRVVRLAISSAGSALVERLDEAAASKTGEMLSALTDTQLEQLIDILETLARANPNERDLQGHPGAGR